jgi:2-amino-4-hydroxy-6-hydroxymethyldihydropteridine diphosphokinase
LATAYLSLGSNQDAEAHLARAARELRERFGAVRLSPL